MVIYYFCKNERPKEPPTRLFGKGYQFIYCKDDTGWPLVDVFTQDISRRKNV